MIDLATTRQRAEDFQALHKKGDPLVLFNCWDVATAKAASQVFPAVATSSGAVAFAQGYDDGEQIPLEFVIAITARMAAAVETPVSIDLEAGYSDDPTEVAQTIETLINNGITGINLEDSLSKGERGLVATSLHAKKIEAIRDVAERLGVPFFINVRTDAFLLNIGDAQSCLSETLKRAPDYASAGASGLFVPFLFDADLIADIADRVSLPLNVLAGSKAASVRKLAEAGVARVSLGGWPFEAMVSAFTTAATSMADTREYPSALMPS